MLQCTVPAFPQVPRSAMEQPAPLVQTGQETQTAQGGLSSADYKRDVAQGIGIQYRLKLETARYNSKAIDLVTYQAESKSFAADYERLYSKWQAVGKGVEFERDCKRQLDRMPMPARKAIQSPSDSKRRTRALAAEKQSQAGP